MRKITVINDDGRSFTAVLRQAGDLLISGHTHEHTREDNYTLGPVVEIFDATYADDKRFGSEGLGQFVSSYTLGTLAMYPGCGINMGAPVWDLSAANMGAILAAFADALDNVAPIGDKA